MAPQLAGALCIVAIFLGSPIGLLRIPYLIAAVWLLRSAHVRDRRGATVAWVTASINAVISIALVAHAAVLLGTGSADEGTGTALGLNLIRLVLNGLIVFFAIFGSIEDRGRAPEKSVV